MVKNLPTNTGEAEDTVSIPGSGRSPTGENVNPLQDSCLGNPMDRGAWLAKSRGLKELDTTEHTDTHHTHTDTHTFVLKYEYISLPWIQVTLLLLLLSCFSRV